MEAKSSAKIDKLYVFNSYCRQDAAIVDELVAALHDTHPTWLEAIV